ncbi:hypothetical protein [Actinoplanes sp. NPDC049265]|uniref:hypothetical protein n=1 Tax=Actinoplanes sp. NPDC049265 TaxID=3363902 RepID=UPI00371B1EBE
MTTVTHQPRVIWNAARAFVVMAEAPYYQDFAEQVRRRLGPDVHDALSTTRERLLDNQVRTGGDRRVADIERGAWRVRLEELLRSRPDLADVLLELSTTVLRY